MNRKRQHRKQQSALSPTSPSSGVADTWWAAPANCRGHDRKTMQLCRQVERALGFAFANAANDDLRDLFVQSVEPAPNASHLLVLVSSLAPQVNAVTLLDQLENARGYLRGEVATSINRRKTPELSFRPVLPVARDHTE